MKSLLLIKAIMFVIVLVFPVMSCTNLDEKLYTELLPDEFFQSEEEFLAALGTAYVRLGGYASGDVNNLQETTTDEMVVPTRGSDWDDGGNWRRLHLHSWKYEDNATGGAWDFCFQGVSTCNNVMYQFQQQVVKGSITQEVADQYAAELRVLRGFFYWQLIDLYGNVPLVLDWATAEAAPPTKTRAEVYNAIVADLEDAVPALSKDRNDNTYGRLTYWAGKTLLAKLYMNAGVYVGTPQWQKVIDICDEIINDGPYKLTEDYFANFNEANNTSSEIIWAIPYDEVFFTGFNLPMQTLHYGSQFTYNLTAQPWNGFCSLEEFYNSYEATDKRKGQPGTVTEPFVGRGNFLAGIQYNSNGSFVKDDGHDKKDPDGDTLNFGNIGTGQPQINELGPQSWRQSGVRIGKWEFTAGATSDLSNDFGIFRLADLHLMKAEALWRLSGDAADVDALAEVNMIRDRAGIDPLASLDGPLSFAIEDGSVAGGELFNEMGREMAFEHNRRQDLIRWGFWEMNAKWTIPFHNVGDVTLSDEYLRLFPINRDKLSANPNLDQNPGYPTE